MQKSIFRIEKFLGLNESLAETELKMGEASKMVNFEITREGNIRRRPGLISQPYPFLENEYATGARVTGAWSGFIDGEFSIACVFGGFTHTIGKKVYHSAVDIFHPRGSFIIPGNYHYFIEDESTRPSKIFWFMGQLWACTDTKVTNLDQFGSPLYIPTILTGCDPKGGGTSLENINIVEDRFKVDFSADGTATDYKLPDVVSEVLSATVDGKEAQGTYTDSTKTFKFQSAPIKGVNNVTILCKYNDPDILANREDFMKMKYHEFYNGSTDGRIFFYGDGTNRTFYTGAPANGNGFYLPLLNEITLDDSPSPITGMSRQDSVLIVTKPDMTYAIRYSPITLADGKVIAGFYPRTISKEIGNDASGQLVLCNNYTRSITGGSIYEWHSTAAYQDQRYAKDVGRRISPELYEDTLSYDIEYYHAADSSEAATYYLCLNGKMLVNRYDIDEWTIYESPFLDQVRWMFSNNGHLYILKDAGIVFFDRNEDFDVSRVGSESSPDDVKYPIKAIWKSGFMHFGADWRKKYSSDLWISTFPEPSSRMVVTVHTDKRNGYARKVIGNNIFDWYNNVDYANWSYNVSRTPKMKRTKIKVKKFVYYQLCFEVESPGARATVLSADMAVNFAGPVK